MNPYHTRSPCKIICYPNKKVCLSHDFIETWDKNIGLTMVIAMLGIKGI